MTEYCPNCGNKVDDDGEFCIHCGYSLVDKKRTFNTLHIILIALVVLIAIVGGILAYSSFSETKTVDIGIATFECSKDLNFTLAETDDEMGYKNYADQTGTYTIEFFDISKMGLGGIYGASIANNIIKSSPSITVDGIEIYNTTSIMMDTYGEYAYTTIIENTERNMEIQVTTPDLEETAIITKNLQLK